MSAADDGGVNEFLAEAEEILESIAGGLFELEDSAAEGDPDPEVINAIFRGAHSLKGISGMFGLAQITEVSHKMETLLDALRMGKIPCERSVLDLLFEGVDLLKTLCSRLASGESAEDSRVGPFVERLLTAAAGGGETSGGGIASLDLGEDVIQVLTEYEVHRIEETLKSEKRTLLRVRVGFSLETFDTDLESMNQALRACGEIISTLPTPGPADEDGLEFDLLVGAKKGVEEVAQVVEPFGARVEVLEPGRAVPTRTPAPDPSAEKSGSAGSPNGAVPPPKASQAPGGRERTRELRSLTETIRVELPKLDALMNLVGELVLAKGRIRVVAERLRGQMGFTGEALELSKAQKELDRKISELRQSVMDVRMVPVGQLFAKLHRVLRKILQDSPKEIDLEIQGAETELDKLIVEDLSDPLIHVIRNAVDHGIEEPAVRERAGKAPRGTVKISARQQGNRVLIEVADDGAGLCVESIRKKAVEKGLLSEDAAVGDKELFDLVFLPGFSTKQQVTELSGRGVGMDVLAKNIAALSGMIELASEKDRGTAVTISLPITLAIIQALIVKVREQTYAMPLNSVLETLALEADQVQAVEGRPVLRLRDTTVPIVHIRQLFDGDDSETLPGYAVIVGVAEKRVAFGVDDLLNQQDIVIKSLGRRLDGLKGLAGATDLGDQNTVLVLDTAALVDEAFAAA